MAPLVERLALLVLLVLPLGAAVPQAPPASAQPAADASVLTVGLPEGLSLDPLVVTEIPPPESEHQGAPWSVSLERVPIGPGASVDGRGQARNGTPVGPEGDGSDTSTHLLYIESGETVLAVEGREETYGAAASVVVPGGLPYRLRNDTDDCISVLRLSAEASARVGANTRAAAAVPVLPPECGDVRTLAGAAGWLNRPPSEPAFAFLARVTWQGQTRFLGGDPSHPGPAGLLIESGTLAIRDPAATDYGVEGRIDQGSSLRFDPFRPYGVSNVGPEPAIALLFGVIPTGEPLWRVGHLHLGRAHRYRLSFDPTWHMAAVAEVWEESAEGRAASLELSNGTSDAVIEDFPYGGEPAACVDDAVARLRDEPGITGIDAMIDADGGAIEGADATRAFARYVFDHERDDGSAARLVAHVECRAFASDEAVLLVMATFPLADLDTQAEPVRRLLDGLVLLE